MFVKCFQPEDREPLKVLHEQVNPRWEVCLCMSEKGFQQVSFCNSIATTKGGRHVDFVADQVITKLIETVKKKNKGGVNIKPFQIKNHVMVFVNCLIENPTFDSQTKENMTLQAKKFGSECKLSDKFIKGALTCGIVESIMSWMKFKAQSQLDKKCHSSKHSKLKGIPKLDDANDAGGKNSIKCTLILTEGDSAKTLAVSGLGVVGRDHYGVFPLRGKLLNVREASHKQIMENVEINNVIKILGLQYKNKYETPDSLKTLRYGKLMIMTDQDQDGSHIKGLLINFIQHNWPNLLHHNFLEEFITPIVKVTKGKETHPFYSLPEFEEWKDETEGSKAWKVKYYKGLKPGQRKVLYTCFKKYEKKEIKVAQMAGAVAELSAYHHGETSLMSTIVNLAQNFVGSNNVNLLQPIGQFGTRLHGGKDAASARYIFTQLSTLSRLLFPAHDDNLLAYQYDDNQRIEPETYIPIIPMVLVNGSEGIGTGWSTKISNYDVREVTANIRRLVAGEEPVPMQLVSLLFEFVICFIIHAGLKPGQRKVLYTCFKKYEKKEIKVAQMAGAVAELSAYHHGETSLMSTIVNLAQNFVGSNNVNLLQPIGQFGTRLHGGKDAASARYIFTQLSTLSRLLFPAHDDNLLAYQYDDNQRIEPETYIPIIPMVLVNGSEGIGTGWSTKISNYDVREVTANIRRLVAGEEPVPMIPSYKGFKGTIEELEPNRFVVSGEISIIDNDTIEITELPVRTWTQVYKEQVLEPMLHGSEKVQPMITDYKEYHTDTTVKFVIKMSEDKLLKAEEQGLHKTFKLQSTISQANVMVLYDSNGVIRRYDNVEEILREFFALRVELYHSRKAYLEGILEAESSRLNNQARFIMEKIEGKIKIENMPKKEMIQILVKRGFDSDPVKAWKESQVKAGEQPAGGEDTEDEEAAEATPDSGPDYNYLLGMALWSLTKEKKDALLKNRDDKARELEILKGKTATMLWVEDLDMFSAELDRVEAQEKEDASSGVVMAAAKGAKGKAKPRKQKLLTKEETRPSPMGRRVVPRIDPAMRKAAEVERKRVKKVKTESGEEKVKEIKKEIKTEPEIPEEEREPLSLAERLAKAKSGDDGVTKVKKQSTLTLKPVKKVAKKVAKKSSNPWSGSESDDDDSPIIQKTKVPRKLASAKITYAFSDDDEEDDIEMSMPREMSDESIKMEDLADEDDGDDDVDGSFIAPPARKKAKKAVIASDKDDEDDDAMDTQSTSSSKKVSDEDMVPKPAAKPKAKATKAKAKKDEKQPSITDLFGKKVAPKRKKMALSSDDESDEVPAKKPAASKTAKKAVKSSTTTSDSDDAFKPKKKTAAKKPAKPKAKPKKKALDWSDDDDDASFRIHDDSSDDVVPPPKRERAGRAKATVKYNFSDEDSDY
eukprot:XP_011660652.1 PREDICTED: DNA topoisomerase 2-alpha [Strongylocentrotus purpuratus]